MKQFIVLAAVLPILFIFVMQFSADQINNAKIGSLSDIVYSAKEEAKQEGCFSEELQEKMRTRISRQLGIPENEIEIDADTDVKYRTFDDYQRGLIHYKVKVPIKGAAAGAGLLGIREEENMYYYVIDSYTASERLEQ